MAPLNMDVVTRAISAASHAASHAANVAFHTAKDVFHTLQARSEVGIQKSFLLQYLCNSLSLPWKRHFVFKYRPYLNFICNR